MYFKNTYCLSICPIYHCLFMRIFLIFKFVNVYSYIFNYKEYYILSVIIYNAIYYNGNN